MPSSPCSHSLPPASTERTCACAPVRRIASRQFALEPALDRAHQRRRVRITPRRELAEVFVAPRLEVDEAAPLEQLALMVVDPVAWERARADQPARAAAIDMQRELQRRPCRGSDQLKERRAADRPRCRDAGPRAARLRERHRGLRHARLRAQRREDERRKRHLGAAEVQRGRSDEAVSDQIVTDDLAVLDVDERAQVVAEAAAALANQRRDVAQRVGRRRIVLRYADRERDLVGAGHGFGGNPRDARDRTFNAHAGHPTGMAATLPPVGRSLARGISQDPVSPGTTAGV